MHRGHDGPAKAARAAVAPVRICEDPITIDLGRGPACETLVHPLSGGATPYNGVTTVPVNLEFGAAVRSTARLAGEQKRFWDYIQAHDPQRYARAAQAARSLGKPHVPVESLDAVVAVVVAGHEDAGRIGPYLSLLAQQSARHFEVYVYINAPAEDPAQDELLESGLSRSVGEIKRSQSRYSRLSVRYMVGIYRGAGPTMGLIRADLWDAIAFDLHTRGRQRDILVIGNDVDTVRMSRGYVSSLIDVFSRGPYVVTTPVHWERVPGLPPHAAANRVMDAAAAVYRDRDSQRGFSHAWDGSVGISLSAYLAVGGYQYVHMIGETNNIAQVIRSVFGREPRAFSAWPRIQTHTEAPWIVSDSRRQVACMAHNCSPFAAWRSDVLPFGIRDVVRQQTTLPGHAERSAQENGSAWVLERAEQLLAATPPEQRQGAHRTLRTLLGAKSGFAWSRASHARFDGCP